MKTKKCKETGKRMKPYSQEEKQAFHQKLEDEGYFQTGVYDYTMSDGSHVLTNCATFAQMVDYMGL